MPLDVSIELDDENVAGPLRRLADEGAPARVRVREGAPKSGEGSDRIPDWRLVDGELRMYVRHKGRAYYVPALEV